MEGRMGRGFLTEPGAVTVRKDCYTIFTEPPRPRRDFISQSSGTGEGNRRLYSKKCREKMSGVEGEKEREREKWVQEIFLSLWDPG